MALRSTHTFAELGLSKAAYDEIAQKLKDAGYSHAFMHDGAIDMHGIGVTLEHNPEPPPPQSSAWRGILGLRGPTTPTSHEIERAYRRMMEDAVLLPQREAIIAARNEAMAEINAYRGPL